MTYRRGVGRDLGVALIAIGLVAVLVGTLAVLGWLGWFGHLPGDLRFERDGGRVRVYAPLASMLVVSLVLTLLFAVVRRLS